MSYVSSCNTRSYVFKARIKVLKSLLRTSGRPRNLPDKDETHFQEPKIVSDLATKSRIFFR